MAKKSSFAGDALKLTIGAILAQAFAVLFSPVLSRLYAPESFGTAAIFTSILGVISAVVCLRYESAIMLPSEDTDAAGLLVGIMFFIGAFTVLTVLGVLFLGEPVCRWLKAPKLESFLWLLPIAVLVNGGCLALRYWNTRLKRFSLLSGVRVATSLTQGTGKLAMGLLSHAGPGSLIGANVIGNVVSGAGLGWQAWRKDRFLLWQTSWRQIVSLLKRYRKFPLVSSWSGLMNAFSVQLPILLLSMFFTQTVVGYYSFGVRIILLPMTLVGTAIGQVFFQRASQALNEGRLDVTVQSTYSRLVSLGLFPLLVLGLIGPEAFVVVFGARWAEAGVYVQIISVWQFFVFVVSPLSTLFSVLERQGAGLIFNIVLLASRVLSLIIGGWFFGNARLALALYAGSGLAAWIWAGWWLLRLSGVSSGVAVSHLWRCLLYAMPCFLFLSAAKWWWQWPAWGILLLAVVGGLVYYGFVVRHDRVLREHASYAIGSCLEEQIISTSTVLVDLRNPYCVWHKAEAAMGGAAEAVQVWVRGHAWYEGACLEGQGLADWLCKELSDGSAEIDSRFEKALQRLNGSFALIARTSEAVLAGVDQLRGIPLFYGLCRNKFLVSDDAERVREFVADTDFDDISVKEFLLTGYVTGAETLYPDVKQIQAGEFVIVKEGEIPEVSRNRYYRFLHGNYFDESEEQLCSLMEEMLAGVFDRLVRSVRGRRIVVPLSGGLDSRLIVAMLKRMDVKNVLCFTYGTQDNWESQISRTVAERLGYEWHFVRETRRRWREWFRSEECRAYHAYGSGLAGLAHLQDWPAVWEMKKAKVFQEGDVIVPGHSADFLAGSHIPSSLVTGKELARADVVDAIIEKHYSLWNWDRQDRDIAHLVKGRISPLLPEGTVGSADAAVDLFEFWDWQERQAKYIVNSVRVYEFWGYDWRLPLWDSEMTDFWSRVSLDRRLGKKLYDSYMERQVLSQLGVGDLHRRKLSGLRWKIGNRIERISDPRLGRYTMLDYIRSWRDYDRKFGNGFKSAHCLLDRAPLNMSIFLRKVPRCSENNHDGR